VDPGSILSGVIMQAPLRFLPVAALLAGLLAFGTPVGAAAKKEMPAPEPFGRLTINQVEHRLGQPGIYIIDGNPPEVFAEHHLSGAANLSHEKITRSVLPADRSATLIFYCMNEL